MASFTNIDVPTTADEFAESVYEQIQTTWPDWQPSPGNLETRLVEAFSRLAEEVSILASSSALAIFRSFGESIINIPPQEAEVARGDSTWTMKDNAGYTITAGTEVIVARTGDERYAFQVGADVVVPPGSTATAAGAVPLEALIAGEDANGLTANPELISAYDYLSDVNGIVLTAPTSGGVDAETEGEYVDRLVEELQLMTPTPILPDEFAVLARRNPSVFRAVAIDGWNGATTTNERYVGLVLLDEAGEDVSSGVKTTVQAELDAMREINFVVYIGAPTYTNIFVTCTVRCYVGFVPADVDAAVTEAITEYLKPYNWGRAQYGEPGNTWINSATVRRNDLIALVDNVPGVNYVESLTLGTSTAPAGTSDISLSGTVPLTRPATTGTAISVTANAGP